MSAVNSHAMHPFPPQHLIDYNNEFLLNQIKNQVEFYFAPQNLQNDRFLQSQLNATEHLGAVPIQVICSFRKIRQLYSYARGGYYPTESEIPADPALLRMALVNSSVVSISHDGMWIIPIPQKDSSTAATPPTVASTPSSPSSSHEEAATERNSIILKDVPENATEAIIMEALRQFSPKSAQSDVGNVWYVVFSSAEDAAAAVASKVTIEGAPIRAFHKNEAQGVPSMPLPATAKMHTSNYMGYPQYPMHPPPPYGMMPMPYAVPPHMPQHYHMQPHFYPHPQYRYFVPPVRPSGMPPPQNVFVRPDSRNNNHSSTNGNANPSYQNKKRNNNQNRKKNRNRQQHSTDQPGSENLNRKQPAEQNKRQSKNNRGKKKDSPKNLDLGKEHFPALGGKERLMPPPSATAKVEGSAYAKALLSSPKKEQKPKSDGGELEKSMKEMAIASDATTPSHENW
eukprot:scaffold22568_cov125-Cylindrotheca_fusiformis.AAC.13